MSELQGQSSGLRVREASGSLFSANSGSARDTGRPAESQTNGAGSILQRDGGGGEIEGEAPLFRQEGNEGRRIRAGLAQLGLEFVQDLAEALAIEVGRQQCFIAPVVAVLGYAGGLK